LHLCVYFIISRAFVKQVLKISNIFSGYGKILAFFQLIVYN